MNGRVQFDLVAYRRFFLFWLVALVFFGNKPSIAFRQHTSRIASGQLQRQQQQKPDVFVLPYQVSRGRNGCQLPLRQVSKTALEAKPVSHDDLEKLTVPELKDMLRDQSLPLSGRKADLIDRLLLNQDSLEENQSHPDEPLGSNNDINTMADEEEEGEETEDESSVITFESLGLCKEALTAVFAQKSWTTPTPCQRLAIPELLKDSFPRDEDYANIDEESESEYYSLLCEAPTGSGKTAAYILPLLQKLLLQERRRRRKPKRGDTENDYANNKASAGIRSLILCPTRELAVQIGDVFEIISSRMIKNSKTTAGWKINVIHGGVPLEPQIASLVKCVDEGLTVDVLVATPGRLVDVLTHYENKDTDDGDDSAAMASLEKRLLAAMDSNSGSRKTEASLSLAQIQELGLDKIQDDGRGELSHLLNDIDYLVLDEADRLLGRAFETEINKVLDLLQPAKAKLQTWLFSATFPKQIEPRIDNLLKQLHSGSAHGSKIMKPPVRIVCAQSDRVLESQQEASGRIKKMLRRSTAENDAKIAMGPASTINLRTIRLDKPDRTQALRKLLESPEGAKDLDRVLVFVATRYASEHVARKLRRVGISSAELHGKLDQEARSRRLMDFSKGKIRVLLATDVAARGLDVIDLPAVVNYDLPRSTADFVHRVGRTGRAGKPGTAITFLIPENEAQYDLIEQRHLQRRVEREVLPGFEPNEDEWDIRSAASHTSVPGALHSESGLAHDRMYGGIKGRRKSKKDRLREQAEREKQQRQK